jgi:endonuclease YncB( thermonuclease family)
MQVTASSLQYGLYGQYYQHFHVQQKSQENGTSHREQLHDDQDEYNERSPELPPPNVLLSLFNTSIEFTFASASIVYVPDGDGICIKPNSSPVLQQLVQRGVVATHSGGSFGTGGGQYRYTGRLVKIRLFGIDAPEVCENPTEGQRGRAQFLHDAANKAKKLLHELVCSFQYIRVVIKVKQDAFRRISALVFGYKTEQDAQTMPLSSATCFNLVILRAGLAWPSCFRQVRSELLFRAFVASMRAAVFKRVGLWSNAMLVLCNSDPKLLQLRQHIQGYWPFTFPPSYLTATVVATESERKVKLVLKTGPKLPPMRRSHTQPLPSTLTAVEVESGMSEAEHAVLLHHESSCDPKSIEQVLQDHSIDGGIYYGIEAVVAKHVAAVQARMDKARERARLRLEMEAKWREQDEREAEELAKAGAEFDEELTASGAFGPDGRATFEGGDDDLDAELEDRSDSDAEDGTRNPFVQSSVSRVSEQAAQEEEDDVASEDGFTRLMGSAKRRHPARSDSSANERSVQGRDGSHGTQQPPAKRRKTSDRFVMV